MNPICELELVLSIQQWPVVWSAMRYSGAKSLSPLAHFSLQSVVVSTHQVLIVGTLVTRYLPRQLHVRSFSVTSGPGLALLLSRQPPLHYEGAQRAEQLRQVQAVLLDHVGDRDWGRSSSWGIL